MLLSLIAVAEQRLSAWLHTGVCHRVPLPVQLKQKEPCQPMHRLVPQYVAHAHTVAVAHSAACNAVDDADYKAITQPPQYDRHAQHQIW